MQMRMTSPRIEPPKVLLMVETSMAFGRGVLEGIRNYLLQSSPWIVHLEPRDLISDPPAWLENWQGDGIVSRSTTPKLAELLHRLQIPTVDLSDMYGDQGFPSIWNDHRAIGRMAGEHLLDRGFERLGFCGFSDQWWANARFEGFRELALERGIEPEKLANPWAVAMREGWQSQHEAITSWLKGLPKPIGIMACNDMRGQHVMEACRQADIAVPEEVAVLGVDNDPVVCDYCNPSLSSVVPDAQRVGFAAAETLDRLMRGGGVSERIRWVLPLEVATRQSTDTLAVDDLDLAAALRFIREHACRGMTMADLLREIPLSRSRLERLFRKYLGRSPQQEMRWVQIKRARHLLVYSELSVQQIASRVGFTHAEYFSVVFKREVGESPGRYRAKRMER